MTALAPDRVRAGRGRPEPHPVDPRTPRRQARPKPPPPKPQPKPPQPKKNGLTVLRREGGFVYVRGPVEALVATAPALPSAELAEMRRLLPPVRAEASAA